MLELEQTLRIIFCSDLKKLSCKVFSSRESTLGRLLCVSGTSRLGELGAGDQKPSLSPCPLPSHTHTLSWKNHGSSL